MIFLLIGKMQTRVNQMFLFKKQNFPVGGGDTKFFR